ncbi:response regulator [Donghicola mangrovi]|uniref:Response regulator n=1 Tax=Donghicola mangrovi TaxID=2729614 RepID=A0A850QDT5_9RHOB|nr:response regulator [Donghicola mangrovi]NVO24309.1 response regulator [Donghicola mangrovi]
MPQSNGLKVLVVEDEAIVAMDLADMLADWGHSVVGPANRAAAGRKLAATQEIDFAILDVNLGGGETSQQIAQTLRERAIPFVFLSAYSASSIEYRIDETVMNKPLIPHVLENHLNQQLAARGVAHGE